MPVFITNKLYILPKKLTSIKPSTIVCKSYYDTFRVFVKLAILYVSMPYVITMPYARNNTVKLTSSRKKSNREGVEK